MGQINMCDKQSKNELMKSLTDDPVKTTQIVKDGFRYMVKLFDHPPPYTTASNNVLSMVGNSQIITDNDYKNTKIVVYQWSPRSLLTLKEQRIKKKQPLDPSEMWTLMHHAVLGYEQIYQKEINNVQNKHFQLCIRMSNMRLFEDDKVLKVAPPFLFNYQGPTKFDYQAIGKNPITILGQIFLDIGLFQQIHLGSDNLAMYLDAFDRKYTENLGKIIRKMIDGHSWDEVKKKLEYGVRISQDDVSEKNYPPSFYQKHVTSKPIPYYDPFYHGKTYKSQYESTKKLITFDPEPTQSRLYQEYSKKSISKVNQVQKQEKKPSLQQLRRSNKKKASQFLQNKHLNNSRSSRSSLSRTPPSVSPSFNEHELNQSKIPKIITIAPPHFNYNNNLSPSRNIHPLRPINALNGGEEKSPKIRFNGREFSPSYHHLNNHNSPNYHHNLHHNPRPHSPSPIKIPEKVPFNENYIFQPSSKDQPLLIFSGIPKQVYFSKTKPDHLGKLKSDQIRFKRHHRQQSPTISDYKKQFSPSRIKPRQFYFQETPSHIKLNKRNSFNFATSNELEDDFESLSDLPNQSRLNFEGGGAKSSSSRLTHIKELINGKAKKYYSDGTYYDGDWVNGKMTGKGKYYYKNGELFYEGQWKQDKYHGKGKIYNYNVENFKGNFQYKDFNKMNQYTDWLSYEGQFKEGKKHGYGILELANGQSYQGQFFEQKIHGKGTFFSKKQNVKGIWKDNKLVEVAR